MLIIFPQRKNTYIYNVEQNNQPDSWYSIALRITIIMSSKLQ